MTLTLLLIGSLFTNTNQGVVVGFLCYEVCIGGMCTPLIPTIWLYLLCDAGCVGICASGGAIPGICFDEKTTVTRITKANEREQVQVTELQPGDIVLSIDILTKEPKTTLVTDNQVILEEYSFVKLIFSYDDLNLQGVYSFIETTEDHVMIIIVKGRHELTVAKGVKLGDRIITSTGEGTIMAISNSKKRSRVQLSTEDGTILANNLLTTTYCAGQQKLVQEGAII